jgi:MFS superfamily sulfate permease-like transporter
VGFSSECNVRIGSFDFSLRELAGSMGDFGTLLPLAIGYITVCGMDPTGLLVMMGLANIVTGLVYRLPMPIEPMKVVAVMAIAQAWAPEKVYAAGITMGAVWLLMGATGAMTHVARWTPKTVVRGIQISLGVLLAVKGVDMMSGWWVLGIASLLVILLMRQNRYAPAAIVLVGLGIAIIGLRGKLAVLGAPSFSLPRFTDVSPRLIWPALRDGGLAQIPLTATNAVIATVALISQYWPDRRVTERQLSLNMGVMNLVVAFFGGMPMCHGAGGLAGQYYFGARTGGTNIIEGTIEIGLGLLLGGSIAALFAAFPVPIVGAMMLMVGVELFKFARALRLDRSLVPVAATVAGAVVLNMAAGFVVGLVLHYLLFGKPKEAVDAQ